MVDLVIYFTRHQQQMLQIEQQKSKSQYQYQQLKQQLNPHFLFNSLNILDYLVLNGEQERASSFIRKLASIYRYLLNTSEAKTLTLQEELEFVNTYTDLLKERFVEGFEISIAVDDALLQKQIIPCALQLLVENAIKHNIANKQHPLHVKIQSKDNKIIVSNNYQPRLSTKPSTGIGLKSIETQYKDISGLSIQVINNKQEFIVTLPLL
jgi:LytS/YehU family sensor histidine kinase